MDVRNILQISEVPWNMECMLSCFKHSNPANDIEFLILQYVVKR